MPSVEDLDIISDFIAEAKDAVKSFERDLLRLEAEPQDPTSLGSLFRTIHSLKGTSGLLGFGNLERINHRAEDLLDKLRKGQMTLSADIIDALFNVLDTTKAAVAHIGEHNREPDDDYAAVTQTIDFLLDKAPPPPPLVGEIPEIGADVFQAALEIRGDSLRVNVATLDKLVSLAGELVLSRNQMLALAQTAADTKFSQISHRIDGITNDLSETVMRTRMTNIGTVFSKLPRLVRDLAKTAGKQVSLTITGEETELDRSIVEIINEPLIHIVRNAIDHGIEKPQARAEKLKTPEGQLNVSAYHAEGMVHVEVYDDGAGMDLEAIKLKAVEKGLISAEGVQTLDEHELRQLVFLPGLSTADQVTTISGRGVGMDVVAMSIKKVGGSIDIDTEPELGTSVLITMPLTLAIIPALMVTVDRQQFAIPQVHIAEHVSLSTQDQELIQTTGGAQVFPRREHILPLIRLHEVIGLTPPDTKPRDILVLDLGKKRFGLAVDRVLDTEEIVIKPLSRHFAKTKCFSGATILGNGQVALVLDTAGIVGTLGLKLEDDDYQAATDATHDADRPQAIIFWRDPDQRMALPVSAMNRIRKVGPDSIQTAGTRRVFLSVQTAVPVVNLDAHLGLTPMPRESVNFALLIERKGRTAAVLATEIIDTAPIPLQIDAEVWPVKGVQGAATIDGQTTIFLEPDDLVDMLDSPAAAIYGPSEITGEPEPEPVKTRTELVLDIDENVEIDVEPKEKPAAEPIEVAPEPAEAQTELVLDIEPLKPFESEIEFSAEPIVEPEPDEDHGRPAGLAIDFEPPEPADDVARRFRPKTILLVDSSPFLRALTRSYLEEEGFRIIEAEQPGSAMGLMRNDPADLIITDLRLPQTTGYQFSRDIKNSFKDAKVLALTTLPGEEDHDLGRQSGIDEFLVKGARGPLITAVSRILAEVQTLPPESEQ